MNAKSAAVTADTATAWVREVERAGFVTMHGVLEPRRVGEVRAELEAILDEDLAARTHAGVTQTEWTRDGVLSIFKRDEHTVMFPLWSSAGLRGLVATLLQRPDIERFLKAVVGEHYRLRIDLVRRSSGVNDQFDPVQTPHEWHCDAPGEFTIGIFFDDLSRQDSGGTTFVPGSHWWPYNPRWDFIIGDTAFTSEAFWLRGDALLIPRFLAKACLINRFLVRPYFASSAREATGQPGDVYFFSNETWHGRAPNVHGGRNIMVRIGAFPTDFRFKDDYKLPGDLATLPPALARRYASGQPVNADPSTLLRRVQARKRRRWDRFRAANYEKKLVDRVIESAYPLALKVFGSRENMRRFFLRRMKLRQTQYIPPAE